jgi:outer membrane receptor protein involved in Fe transport
MLFVAHVAGAALLLWGALAPALAAADRHEADGVFYLGPGRSPGYAVLNFAATVQASRGLSLFGRIASVLDRRYATAAQLGVTGFDASGRYVGQPFPPDAQGRVPLRGSTFFAPGAPRLFSAGLRYAFD